MSKRDWERLWRAHSGADAIDPLGREVLAALQGSVVGWRDLVLLEAGAGTGTISLELARAGARVAMIDFARDAIQAIQSRSARDPRVEVLAVADVRRLPFRDGSFDVVWSSGVLEHFSEGELARVLDESARVSRRYVVSFVPNLNCSFYLLWSYLLKLEGQWSVGFESPKASLRYAFENAGIEVLREFSVGFDPENFLRQLPSGSLRDHLAFHYRQLPPERREGYLLATVGVKARSRANHATVEYTEDEETRLVPAFLAQIRWARAMNLYARVKGWASAIMRRVRDGG